MQRICDLQPADCPIGEGSQYTRAEIASLIRDEQVETLSDLVLRRTSLGITGAVSLSLIESLSKLIADELGLSHKQAAQQSQDLIQELQEFYGVSPEVLSKRSQNWSELCD